MEPIALKHNFSSFYELASACYAERIDLSAHSLYITPDTGLDWKTGKGAPFSYFAYGALFSEAEIDTLTGDFLVSSVFFAIKDAIASARAESGHTGWFPLDIPATPDSITMACLDEFTAPFVSTNFCPKLSVV
ncbi:hypothetical protein SAY87_013645 [Trapa incisa]|uniref:Aldehyde oxidase/xanthine dehydrogenase second molybdopterin binding domain-containing protein n=1 Tax=Trapa incisa TaxID=236973 RepID=A0AAN7QD91_9MYRT|nr:hypothetical protein SAY87_013645 [Trapa incisa]